jgi:hypothetical protein
MKKKLTYSDFLQKKLNNFLGGSQPNVLQTVWYSDVALGLHELLFGGTGAGKTTLLIAVVLSLAIRIVLGLYKGGFAILSPHPDFFYEVRDRLALLALDFPVLYELIYILDPTNEAWSAKYNLLEVNRLQEGESIEARADEAARLIAVLNGDDITRNVRQQRIMANTFLAVMLSPELSTIHDALKFLQMGDEGDKFRDRIARQTGNERLIRYWCYEFKTRRDKAELIESTMNRIERFATIHGGLSFFWEGPSTVDFLNIMNNGGILLVNGNKGKLKGGSSLFLGFIMFALQNAAMERLDMPTQDLPRFTVQCDEGQVYMTDTIREAAKESRKVKVNFTLATQSPKDLEKNEALLEVLRDVVGNLKAMRLNRDGAEVIAKSMFTSDLNQVKAYVDGKPIFKTLQEVQEEDIRNLTELPPQMVWWKQIGQPAQLIRTPTVKRIQDLPRFVELPAARRALDQAAFRLAGARKYKRLPLLKGNEKQPYGVQSDTELGAKHTDENDHYDW